MSVLEPARELCESGEFDVVVAGGGIAGVAAAVSAARNGASVIILERSCALGGLATLGNVTVWLPLCDGKGRQVTAGLAEEMLRLSVRNVKRENRAAQFTRVPACWETDGDTEQRKRVRFRVGFNATEYLLELEKLVVQAGVTLLYDTRVCDVRREREQVSHVIVENKSGRSAVRCGVVIDATGDADVCHLAGEETESLDTSVLSGWFYHLGGDGLHLTELSNRYCPSGGREGAAGPFFRGDDAEEVTAQIVGSREMLRQRLTKLRAQEGGEEIQPMKVPTIACMRMTRRLVGSFSLGAENVHEWFEDTVGLTGDWRKAGPVYAIPMRGLLGVRNRNLLAVGRCMSVSRTAWDVTRALPGCAASGEAAGTAAALAVRDWRGDVHTLPIRDLQSRLKTRGVLMDEELVRRAGE